VYGKYRHLFPLFREVKKEIRDSIQPWSIRFLTDFRQHAQYCSFPLAIPVEFQPPGMPTTCRFFRGLNDRLVPEAEVNPGILNGSFGGNG
jgi:hypothetical protein